MMATLESRLNPRSEDFNANAAAMQRLVDDLKEKVAQIAMGGGEDARKKHLARGMGLATAADIATAAETANFCLSEARIGLIKLERKSLPPCRRKELQARNDVQE